MVVKKTTIPEALPLASLQSGRKARLLEVHGGRRLQSHLLALGLVQGREISMLNNTGCGPVILGLGNSRLSLGRGAAHKIIVQAA